jgi:hypothetical protein
VYIAAVTWRSVLVYDRDPATDVLTPRGSIAIGSGGDNIEVDDEGQLWIGASKLLAVPKHAADPANLAPRRSSASPPTARPWTRYTSTTADRSARASAPLREPPVDRPDLRERFPDCEMEGGSGASGAREPVSQ